MSFFVKFFRLSYSKTFAFTVSNMMNAGKIKVLQVFATLQNSSFETESLLTLRSEKMASSCDLVHGILTFGSFKDFSISPCKQSFSVNEDVFKDPFGGLCYLWL